MASGFLVRAYSGIQKEFLRPIQAPDHLSIALQKRCPFLDAAPPCTSTGSRRVAQSWGRGGWQKQHRRAVKAEIKLESSLSTHAPALDAKVVCSKRVV